MRGDTASREKPWLEVAVLGPPGAGKTTLVHALADRAWHRLGRPTRRPRGRLVPRPPAGECETATRRYHLMNWPGDAARVSGLFDRLGGIDGAILVVSAAAPSSALPRRQATIQRHGRNHAPEATPMIPTLHAAADDLRAGRLTPVDLLEACLQRIDALEDRVRAWVFVDREGAREEAERRTAELKHGAWRGPLHGVPIGIKDIFDVFDWPTAAGSRLWKDSIARRDATAVRKLREAGAVFVGKTVTTQYASFDPPPTRNPWDATRTPGGSSSGSAAAVACGMCLAALGSQTGGSITRPAAFCGVAGLKPTYGRVSTFGVVPLAASMDHVGPIGRCVRDLAAVLQVIAGPDPFDPDAADAPVPDYTALLRGSDKPRLGRLRGLFENLAAPVVLEKMEEVCNLFRSAGATVREVALPIPFADVIARHRTIMAVEAAAFHGPRLRRHPEDYDPNIRSLLEEGLACPAPRYARAKEHQRSLKKEMEACFQGVDALLTPATATPAPPAATTGDPVFNSPWSYTGLPTVTFPMACDSKGMPLGLQLVGRPWGEDGLLAVAAWCEEALGFRMGEPGA